MSITKDHPSYIHFEKYVPKEQPTTYEQCTMDYSFIRKDYAEGLNYGVSKEIFIRLRKVYEAGTKKTCPKEPTKRDAENYLNWAYLLLNEIEEKN